jgi:hypothetical protein
MLQISEQLREDAIRALMFSRPEKDTVFGINQIAQQLRDLKPIEETEKE